MSAALLASPRPGSGPPTIGNLIYVSVLSCGKETISP